MLSKTGHIITKFHGEVAAGCCVPDDGKLRARIQYLRRKEFGVASGGSDAMENVLTNMKTVEGENFVLYDDGANNNDIFVFGTMAN